MCTDTHRSRTPGDPLSQADHLTPVDLLVVLAGALIVSILHVERPILMGIDVHCTRARNRAAWRTAVGIPMPMDTDERRRARDAREVRADE